MTEYRSLTARECAERLLAIDDPTVCAHVRPDGDAVGSMTALAEIFRQLGKPARILPAKDTPERLDFLTEGIEKTDCALGTTLVSVDTASPSQLGEIYEKQLPVLSIDHHKVNTPYCDNYTLPDSSSAGETLYRVVEELEAMGRLTLTQPIAQRLYAAIASDTGGFVFSNATESTYRIAARLVSVGIDHAEINRRLFHSKGEEQIRAEGYAALNLKTAKNGLITYLVLSKSERDALALPFGAFETAIDVVRGLRGSEIAFVLKETDDGKFKASIRSVSENVAEIAARHSGGGHVRAAGCTIEAENIEKASEILLSELTELI